MDFNTDVRRVQLESLEQFITASKDKVQTVLDYIGWTPDRVLKDAQLATCSLDTTHKIPAASAGEHVRRCQLRKEGYDPSEAFLSEPPSRPSRATVALDDHRKIEVLSEAHKRRKRDGFKARWNWHDPDPKTSDRLLSTYSPDERLALYDYCVTNTEGPPVLPEYDTSVAKSRCRSDAKWPSGYEEQLARERDAKRRRVKYRSVHTSRKSHTEVLREVIGAQMELYAEWAESGASSPPPPTRDEPRRKRRRSADKDEQRRKSGGGGDRERRNGCRESRAS